MHKMMAFLFAFLSVANVAVILMGVGNAVSFVAIFGCAVIAFFEWDASKYE